jgi:membrane protease YdiL (CAAX protease family)
MTMQRRPSGACLWLFGCAALAIALSPLGTSAQNAEPIRIGVIGEESSVAGASLTKAAAMAAEEINAHGGVNGRQIEVITYDDHSSAADAVRAFQRAVSQDKVVAVIASYISEVVLAIEPWSARLHMPFITPGAASNLISKAVHDDYFPAFAATAFLRPPLPVAISLIIGISLCAALVAMVWLSTRGTGFAAFGFAAPPVRSMIPAITIGVPLALGAVWLASAFPSPAPIDIASLAPWQQVLFFVIAAPVQEEIIFRGLIQSMLQMRLPGAVAIRSAQLSYSVLCTAVLFAIVHMGSGFATIVGALVLSVLAGELRRRTGSLLPAMLVHSLFNIATMLVSPA